MIWWMWLLIYVFVTMIIGYFIGVLKIKIMKRCFIDQNDRYAYFKKNDLMTFVFPFASAYAESCYYYSSDTDARYRSEDMTPSIKAFCAYMWENNVEKLRIIMIINVFWGPFISPCFLFNNFFLLLFNSIAYAFSGIGWGIVAIKDGLLCLVFKFMEFYFTLKKKKSRN